MLEGHTDTEARNLALVRAAFAAWRDGTGNVFALLAEDAQWTIAGYAPVSRTYRSRQEFLDVVITPFNGRMSSRLIPETPRLYADGHSVVARFDAHGVARDGRPYRNSYAWFMTLRDGLIVDVTAFFDTIHFTDLWTRIAPE